MYKFILLSFLVSFTSTQVIPQDVITILNQGILVPQNTRVAYYCPLGSFWNNQTCIPCLQVTDGYCNCTIYNTCTASACNIGYFNLGSTTNPNCQPCGNGCQSCYIENNAVVCYECYQNFQNVGGVCLGFDNMCLEYSNTTGLCTGCLNAKYLDIWDDEQNEVCMDCSQNCQSCYGPNQCDECFQGSTLNYTSNQISCVQCGDNCQQCSTNGVSCQVCVPGNYVNTQGQCTQCSNAITNCQYCNNNTICTGCFMGYVWNTTTGSCETWGCSAVPQCGTCNGSICVGCYGNYFLSGGQCYEILPNCMIQGVSSSNVSQCNTCYDTFGWISNDQNCQTCTSPSVVAGTSSAVRCSYSGSKTYIPTQCLDGSFLYNSTCVSVQTSNCSTIGSAVNTNCSSCFPGWSYNSVNFTCVSTPGCQKSTLNTQYDTGFNCTQCSDGYYLYQITNGYQCALCSSNIAGCLSCSNSTFCTNCNQGYNLNVAAGTCQQCQTSNCLTCAANGTGCTACLSGYTFNNYTNLCTPCQNGCSTCTNYGMTCQTCSQGFVLQNGACVSLTNANCLSQNSTGCTVCVNGYYLVGQYCVLCVNPTSAFVCRGVPNPPSPPPTPTPNIHGILINSLAILASLVALLI